MKKFLFLVVSLLFTANLFAQHEVGAFTLQPKIGMNIANITGEDDTDPRIGLAIGVEGEYQIHQMFSLSAGLLFSMQGAKEEGYLMGYKSKLTDKLNYLNIPIMANLYVVKGLALKVGIQPAFNLAAAYELKMGGESESGDLDDLGVDIKSFDFAIPVGLSYEYKNFVIDGRYNIGVTKLVDEDSSKNSVFQFTLGYKFQL